MNNINKPKLDPDTIKHILDLEEMQEWSIDYEHIKDGCLACHENNGYNLAIITLRNKITSLLQDNHT